MPCMIEHFSYCALFDSLLRHPFGVPPTWIFSPFARKFSKKRRMHKIWQTTRHPDDKNDSTGPFRLRAVKNRSTSDFLSQVSPSPHPTTCGGVPVTSNDRPNTCLLKCLELVAKYRERCSRFCHPSVSSLQIAPSIHDLGPQAFIRLFRIPVVKAATASALIKEINLKKKSSRPDLQTSRTPTCISEVYRNHIRRHPRYFPVQ